MKQAKKLASLLLALVMVFALTATAFADEGETQPDEPTQPTPTTHTITITHKGVDTGHTYEAYQIFSGTASKVGNDTVLSNVQWGSGVDQAKITELVAALAAKNRDYATCTTAEAVANVLMNSGKADAFASVVGNFLSDAKVQSGAGVPGTNTTTYQISGLGDGYYFVKDVNKVTGNDFSTRYILQVVGEDVSVSAKNSVPTVIKEVKDRNDTSPNDPEKNGWGETADHDIGDNVSFRLTASLSSNFYVYETYKLEFHDTLSSGLDFNADSLTVSVADTTMNKDYYTVAYNSDTHKLDVTIPDLKNCGITGITGSNKVIVTYTAKLNENAVVGGAGNPNTVYLDFSNNPYSDDMGSTPPDTVIVFTFSTIVNKVHEVGEDKHLEPLKGAAFKLEKSVPGTETGWVTVKTINDGGDQAQFTFSGLDDGKYRLTETTVPDGYNKIRDIYFKVVTTHGMTEDGTPVHTIEAYQVEENSDTMVEGSNAQIFTPNQAGGSISTNVVNKAGATLPTTGGIGTTLFYVIGSVLVLAAVVLLVTKKRMNAQN